MEVIIQKDAAAVGTLAADVVAATVRRNEYASIGVATGSSPVTLYQELGRLVAAGELSLRHCQAFMLDEYVGLPPGDAQRYRTFIEQELVAVTDLPSQNVDGPDGNATDLAAECLDYEARIRAAGGVDVQILGIGADGHIAFNEPGSSLASRTRIKTLTQQTRADNARFFDGDLDRVPLHCLTQGIGTILDARHLLLVATGRGKAEAVHRMVEGAVSAMWPASSLQLHPKVTVILDEGAASRLQLRSYYEDAWRNKPTWQTW